MEHKRRKKKVKKSTIIKIVAGIVIAGGILTGVVIHLRNRVKDQFARTSASSIKNAVVESGSISTTVYGTGRLEDDDMETQEIPEGVKLTELKVEVGDTVKKGAVIASADLSTVLSAMLSTRTTSWSRMHQTTKSQRRSRRQSQDASRRSMRRRTPTSHQSW